jgi:protein LSM12
MNALRAREASAIRAAHAARARLGPKGTTKEHQDIFDAIARTHPVKWQPNGSILVNDGVLIDKPYQPDNCRLAPGGNGPAGGVERIRKVLKMEREKLDLKAARFDVGKAGLKEGGLRKGG